MIEARSRFRLAQEPPPDLRGLERLRAGHLERDLAPEHRIRRQEDHPEGPPAQLAHDQIATETRRDCASRKNDPRPDRLEQSLALMHRLEIRAFSNGRRRAVSRRKCSIKGEHRLQLLLAAELAIMLRRHLVGKADAGLFPLK